jgi:isoleucyl-tRNA synthetase
VATADAVRRTQVLAHADLIAAELGVKRVDLTSSSEEFAEVEVMPLLKLLGPKYGRDLDIIRGLLREGEFTLDGDRVQVGDWVLERDEFELRTRAREGFAVVDGDGFAVALDTEITPELALEGTVRDVIRQVQELRKAAGLAVTDRIKLTYPRADGEVTAAFERHGEWIASETLAVALTPGPELAVQRDEPARS